MACSRNDNLRVFSNYIANLASLFSHFLMPVDDAVCQGNRCQLSTAIAYASCITCTSNRRTFHCRNQGTNCNSKWAVYAIMCDACGMQYVGQTNNNRSHKNGHKSYYRRFLKMGFFYQILQHFPVILNKIRSKFSSSTHWNVFKMKVLDILMIFAKYILVVTLKSAIGY